MIIKLLVVGPLMRSLQGGLGGLFGGGSFATDGIGGFGPTAPVGQNAAGTDSWRGGETWVGESGPEKVRLPAGSQIVPNDIARQRGADGAITINNYSDAKPTAAKAPNGDVTITIEKFMDDAVGKSLSSGTGRRVLGNQFGVKPFTGQ
ncbi:hypothetical protein ABIF68_007305 [Bradyrhizobium japonicum]|uniref:hypothetical protein n=1 Tax=Bradyrhizobium TaxID=374 RepID=UPI0004B407DB|nr:MULTISPECIES: hypothetical protein [Bradyrhizobium]MBR0940263.1 hypothetical protein [Bradyrhizobium liaoningense]MDI2069762.1 hypothetical protein [Bradyrhizobium sp. Mp27]